MTSLYLSLLCYEVEAPGYLTHSIAVTVIYNRLLNPKKLSQNILAIVSFVSQEVSVS